MNEQAGMREWQTNEQLPATFVKLLNEAVREQQRTKAFIQIAVEWDVDAGLLSRWMGGTGPLFREHIQKLAAHLGSGVFTALGLVRPEDDNNSNYQEP